MQNGSWWTRDDLESRSELEGHHRPSTCRIPL